MPSGTLQIKAISGHSGSVPGPRRAPRGGGLQVHRRDDLHRLQGVRGRVRRVERHAVPPDDLRQHLPDDAVDGVELLEPDQVQRAPSATTGPACGDAQGPVHALRGSRLPARVSGRRRHRPVHERHRRLQSGELHRLSVLRARVPVRHPEIQPDDQESLQVHAVLRPRRPGSRACVHQGVSDRLPEFGTKVDMLALAEKRAAQLREHSGLRRTPASTIRRPLAARTSSTCCTTHEARVVRRSAGEPDRSRRAIRCWKSFAKPVGLLLALLAAPVAFFHYIAEGPKDPQPPVRKETE